MIKSSGLVLAAGVILLGACAEPPDSAGKAPQPDSTEYRFVVEIEASLTQSALAEIGERLFSSPVDVEPLFSDVDLDDDPDGLAQFYILTTDLQDADRNVWDMSYALLDAAEIVAAEPDMEDVLAEVTARAGAAIDCFGEGVPAPTDRAWALRQVRAPEAWALTPKPSGKRFGEDVQVCHIDTGWADHVDLDSDRFDLDKAWNALDRNDNAEDPLGYRGSPGHGTATGSVIMSSGGVDGSGTTGPGLVTGVAPKSTLVSIRAVKNVVQFLDSDVARAVRHATRSQCDVISMSLGGRAFIGLKRAIGNAVRNDTIVVAAAGNCVGFVVAPAMYKQTIAVAASNVELKPWKGTSKGSAVTISAPGEDVYRAKRKEQSDPENVVEPSDGTSYATAMVAGAAALWISNNGSLTDGRTRQARFQEAIRATAKSPSSWDHAKLGSGIVDIEALLQFVPPKGAIPPAATVLSPGEEYVEQLALQTGIEMQVLRSGLIGLVGEQNFEENMHRLGPELLYLAATQPQVFVRSLGISGLSPDLSSTSTARESLSDHSSNTLSVLLRN